MRAAVANPVLRFCDGFRSRYGRFLPAQQRSSFVDEWAERRKLERGQANLRKVHAILLQATTEQATINISQWPGMQWGVATKTIGSGMQ
jgi:hypothetical protein